MIAALGFRAHSGWAVVVAAAGSSREPVVLHRSRIETADPGIPGSRQPYHAAQSLDRKEAENLIRKCLDSSTALSLRSVRAIIAQLADEGHTVVAAAIVTASGRPLPDLAATLRSHALLHTAEGEFFREALVRASAACSLPLTRISERDIRDKVAALPPLGRSLGPPWGQDEKLASLAAWKALSAAPTISL